MITETGKILAHGLLQIQRLKLIIPTKQSVQEHRIHGKEKTETVI